MLHVRPWDRRDAPAVRRLKTAFATNTIYDVVDDGVCLCLRERVLDTPLLKTYPAPDQDNPSDAFVAEIDGRIAGYAELVLETWNRRGSIRHLYVSEPHRGQGIGTALLAAVVQAAQAADARCLWIETQNVNYPAIQFYRRVGFVLAGLDRSLYDPVSTPGEIALFFSRDI